FPFIIKHNRAGKGLGVNLFDRIDELEDYVNSDFFEDSVDGISLLQAYVKPVNGRVYRSEFIGGKFHYVVSIDSSEGFELCPADNCQITIEGQVQSLPDKFQIVDGVLNKEEIHKIENFLKAENIQVAAVEFIETADGQKWAYDVNTNTNYNADAEEVAQKFGMLALAEYLGDLLAKI
ncbi:ATP-grasp domain-containing protein, partial [Aerococcus sp. L_32]